MIRNARSLVMFLGILLAQGALTSSDMASASHASLQLNSQFKVMDYYSRCYEACNGSYDDCIDDCNNHDPRDWNFNINECHSSCYNTLASCKEDCWR